MEDISQMTFIFFKLIEYVKQVNNERKSSFMDIFLKYNSFIIALAIGWQ